MNDDKPIKRRRLLSYELRCEIILLAQKGYAMRSISSKLGVPYSTLNRYFLKWRPENYKVVPAIHNSKREPYHKNEDDYGDLPQYKWEDLSLEEINLYLEGNYK